MIENPKVSVVMPVYDAEKYLREAIESILNQTFKEFEFIIIDDDSVDESWGIIQEYADRDERIIASKNKKNLGIAGNRNRGLSLMKGRYVVWQDADDISIPTRVEKQYEFMEENPEVGIVGGYLQFFNEKRDLSIRKYTLDDKSLRKTIFRYSPVAEPGAMIRKKCLDELGGYNLRYPPAADLDMSFRIGSKYKFANLQEVVIKYREHVNSATFTKLKEMELNTLEIRNKAVKEYGYKMTILDKIYWILQYLSIYIVPPRIKLWLFNKIRNSKL